MTFLFLFIDMNKILLQNCLFVYRLIDSNTNALVADRLRPVHRYRHIA